MTTEHDHTKACVVRFNYQVGYYQNVFGFIQDLSKSFICYRNIFNFVPKFQPQIINNCKEKKVKKCAIFGDLDYYS